MLKSFAQTIKEIRNEILEYAIEALLDKDTVLSNLVYNKIKNITYNSAVVENNALKRIIEPMAEGRFCITNFTLNEIANLCSEEYTTVINSGIDEAVNCTSGSIYLVCKCNAEVICNGKEITANNIKYSKSIDTHTNNNTLGCSCDSKINLNYENKIVDLCSEDYIAAINSGIDAAVNCMSDNVVLVCKCIYDNEMGMIGNIKYASGVTGEIEEHCMC